MVLLSLLLSFFVVHGALLGAVDIGQKHYMVHITEQLYLGRLYGKPVFKIVQVSLTCPGQRKSAEASMAESFLSDAGMYYAQGMDLSLSAGRSEGSASSKEHFLANQKLLSQLKATESPVLAMRGYVGMNCIDPSVDARLQNTPTKLCYALISRISSKRTSTRYTARGGSASGDVANFTETELLLSFGKQVASFSQLRGQVPMKWKQVPVWTKRIPDVAIDGDDAEQSKHVQSHFQMAKSMYGQVAVLNLLDSQGRESELSAEYERRTKKLYPQMLFKTFDYHKGTSAKDWKEEMVKDFNLDKIGFHFASQRQSMMIRTNCLDCLDRTNAAQAIIASFLYPQMLRSLLPDLPDLSHILSAIQASIGPLWADNGNAISCQLAGTGALKTDVARLGRRTVWGMATDGYRTGKRYFQALLYDKSKADAMALVFGSI